MDLKEEDILGDKINEHWYYVSKGRAMRKFLDGIKVDEVLDVGAGSGIFSRQLLDYDICQSSVCVDLGYDKESNETHNGKPIKFVKSLNKTTQDLILMMDVLEHVLDDVALIREYTDSMPAGGKLLITVPAFQFMWSGHDMFLEHYRRYNIEMIEKSVVDSGLIPINSKYFFGSLFPAVAALRLTKRALFDQDLEAKSELKLYPDWLNKALIAIHDVECMSLFKINKLFGLSVFCLCEKPKE